MTSSQNMTRWQGGRGFFNGKKKVDAINVQPLQLYLVVNPSSWCNTEMAESGNNIILWNKCLWDFENLTQNIPTHTQPAALAVVARTFTISSPVENCYSLHLVDIQTWVCWVWPLLSKWFAVLNTCCIEQSGLTDKANADSNCHKSPWGIILICQ